MDNLGIGVGVKDKFGNTNWYRAHSIVSGKRGVMHVYALDENRTAFVIPAKDFAGVAPEPRCGFSKTLYPDILDVEAMKQYK